MLSGDFVCAVIDSHSEEKVSLRVDKPWPALVEKSMSIDFGALDQTDHGHVPFVYILVQAAEKWKASVRSSSAFRFLRR